MNLSLHPCLLLAFGMPFLAPAAADEAAYPMPMSECTKALRDTAQQVGVPLTLRVNTPQRKEFAIQTAEGLVVMRCDAPPSGQGDALMTVLTPAGADIQGAVDEGYRKAMDR